MPQDTTTLGRLIEALKEELMRNEEFGWPLSRTVLTVQAQCMRWMRTSCPTVCRHNHPGGVQLLKAQFIGYCATHTSCLREVTSSEWLGSPEQGGAPYLTLDASCRVANNLSRSSVRIIDLHRPYSN